MEVKKGYKRTEVGVIPEDWRVAVVDSLVSAGPRNGYSGRTADSACGTKTLSLSATTSGRMLLTPDTVKHLIETIPHHSDLFLRPGDVLVQRANTIELVGTTAIFDGPQGVYVYPDLMMRLRFREIATAHFFWRFSNSTGGRRFFMGIAAGSSGSMPKIGGANVKRMPIPLPPLSEQKAIAEALSDVDDLIASLERLIAKKRDIKAATMGQLLTGRTRLPGFTGKWERKRLGELGICLRGVSYRGDNDLFPYDTPATKRLLRSSNVQDAAIVTADVQFVRASCVSARQVLMRDDILICMANGSKALVGKAGRFKTEDGYAYTFGAFMGCFRTERGLAVPEFVFGLFLTEKYRGYIAQLLAGSSINNLRPSSIASLEFSMPPLPEQAAIAGVLSDMDAEIEALESRLAKTRMLKQGMMQELLTGRTRLV
jgi:type I restriction enzyme, S subunit